MRLYGPAYPGTVGDKSTWAPSGEWGCTGPRRWRPASLLALFIGAEADESWGRVRLTCRGEQPCLANSKAHIGNNTVCWETSADSKIFVIHSCIKFRAGVSLLSFVFYSYCVSVCPHLHLHVVVLGCYRLKRLDQIRQCLLISVKSMCFSSGR